jgi:hypothetical protein
MAAVSGLLSLTIARQLAVSCAKIRLGAISREINNLRSFANLVNSGGYFKRKSVIEAVNSDIVTQPASKFFAVVYLAGKQHKVTLNDILVVNSLEADIGSEIFLNKVH